MHPWLSHFQWRMERESRGTLLAECPHCHQGLPLSRHALVSEVMGLPLPRQEILVCPGCHKLSRSEGLFSRVVGAGVLLGMLAFFAGVAGVGLYLLKGMMDSRELSLPFSLIALILLGAAGRFGWGAFKMLRRLFSSRLIPMGDNLLTRM